MSRLRHLVRRRRKPGETSSPRIAILNFCRECVGWVRGEVEQCTGYNCHLWPLRLRGSASTKGEDVEQMRRNFYDASKETEGNHNSLPPEPEKPPRLEAKEAR